MDSENKYAKFIDEAPSDDQMSRLATMIKELYDAELEVLRCEKALKDAKKTHTLISEKTIPNHMESIGLAEFKTKSGTKIKVESKVSAKPSKDNMPRVIEWLIKNKHEGLIKRTLSMLFGVKEKERADKVKAQLMKDRLPVRETMKVETSTLSAWVRKWLEEGNDLPMKMFGVYDKRVAKIVEGKPKDVFDGENL